MARKKKVEALEAQFQVRASPEILKGIDDWRRAQEDLPSRAEAIRRLLVKVLEIERKKQARK